ncbi:carboxypeptidase regulatory-like domain-containing protein [Paractinoplanes durhamensis]|uniref:carboxypeptidase regulatory-like domain-containing protein n=1 Tax=Paractinoplanes durhamensis TaxID=113563 RepID=UPI00362C9C95
MSRFRARLGYAVVAGLLAVGAFAAPASAAAGGTVQGDFVTVNDNPIANAYVTAWTADQSWLADTTTDGQGQFRLAGLPAGGVLLQFDDNGRQQWSPGVREPDEATVYQVTEGGTVTVAERQPATGRIAGHLTDAAGNPTPNWTNVSVEGVSQSAHLYANTDENGDWAVDAFPGTYRVSFRWESAVQWAVQSSTEDGARTFTVTAGRTTTADDRTLPTGTISGRITNKDGGPLPDAFLTLHQGATQVGWSNTDQDGNYTFGQVVTGDGYTVSFNVDNGTTQWVAGAADQAGARRFTVAEGATTTVDDQQLAPAGMHGRLVDTTGAARANYSVYLQLITDDGWTSYSATTGEDGTWSVADVVPGNYKVSFTTPDWRRTQWAHGKNTEAEATPITVAPGADATVDETWLPGATLVVTAVDAATGAPVRDFCAFVDSWGDGSGCTTGSTVTLEDLPGGSYHLSATPGDDSYYLPSGSQPVTLTGGATSTATVRLTLGGKVSFVATDRATGKGVAEACAVFRVLGHGGLPDGYGDCSDVVGNGISGKLATGTYELFAVAPAPTATSGWAAPAAPATSRPQRGSP